MPTKTTPKDFFLHLGATIALYISVVALMNLVFQIINRAFPDVLQSFYGASDIVWPVSILIVVVPIFYVLEWLISRDIIKMPEKLDLGIRKWKIYLTLFLTGATIAGDLVVLISTYLNGEVTNRFIFKVLAVMIVSVVIFAYYILVRMTETAKIKIWRKALAWLGIVFAIAAIVGGFVIVGSPSTQRSLRLDSQRVNDLTNIQYQIVNYWQRTGKLPGTIQTLNDPLSNFIVLTDPLSHDSYEYLVKNSTANSGTFQLCAIFDLPSSSAINASNKNLKSPSYPIPVGGSDDLYGSNWNHAAGHACFERNIDLQRYPINLVSPKNP